MEYKLKDLIERVTIKNNTLDTLLTHVIDVYDGILDRPSRDASESNRLGSYQVVEPYQLVLGTPALNRRLQCAINLSGERCIANVADIVFLVNKSKVLPEYMHMYLNTLALRPDIKARLVDRSYNFTIEDLLEITIDIPTLPTQKKYLSLHKGFLQALNTTRQDLDQIKETCDQAVDLIKGRRVKLADYVTLSETEVTLEQAKELKLDTTPFFDEAVTLIDANGQEQIEVPSKQIYDQLLLVPAFSFYYKNVFGTGKWHLHFNGAKARVVPDDNYIVFSVKDDQVLVPEFLNMELNTTEAAEFVKENESGAKSKKLEFSKLGEFKVELPKLEVQLTLSKLYNVYAVRKKAYDELVREFQNFCAIYCLN